MSSGGIAEGGCVAIFGNAMIVGSGLIARAFAAHASSLQGVCFYAAGVSNSSCRDPREFERDRERLRQSIDCPEASGLLVYFSTCSVEDPASLNNAYTRHKRELEEMIRARDGHLILRLPQVAGRTPNPHTILNYLHARMVRSERFELWRGASRNIIDVEDVRRIALDLIDRERARNETINVANPRSSTMLEIVEAFERTTRRNAIYDTVDKGARYEIDTTRIADSIRHCGIAFDDAYLPRTLAKYYE